MRTLTNLMNMTTYVIDKLLEYLEAINKKRATTGKPVIDTKNWSAFLAGSTSTKDVKQSWIEAHIPKGTKDKSQPPTIKGMDNKAKLLKLYSATNECLRSHRIPLIPDPDVSIIQLNK